MPLVALDTNTCIWCINEFATPGQEEDMKKAVNLRSVLSKAGYDILIPIPVVTELLSNIADPLNRQSYFEEIKKTFFIGDFDEKAALLLSEILNYHYQNREMYQSLGIKKVPLKYDALIIAIAKSAGAECLFAHDPDCKKIAAHFFTVKGLDERPDSIEQNIGVFSLSEAKRILP